MKWIRSLRVGAALSALALVFSTAACMKTDEKVALEKDGSGTIDQTIVIDTSKIKELMEMFKGMMPQPEPGMGEAGMGDEGKKDDDISKGFSKEEIEKQIKEHEGLELKDYSHETKDGKDHVHMVIAFKSFEQACKAGMMGSSAVNLVKNEDGSFTLSLDAKAGKGGEGGADSGGMEQMMPMLEPYLSGFEMKTQLTFPGAITDTNGTKSEDGKQVSWTIGWKQMSGADKEHKDATSMKVTFKGEGVDWKPFSIKPDAEKAASKFGFGGGPK